MVVKLKNVDFIANSSKKLFVKEIVCLKDEKFSKNSLRNFIKAVDKMLFYGYNILK